MERALGRRLSRFEYVHHIDGNKRNNALENLLVTSPAEHAREHFPGPREITCRLCGALKRVAPSRANSQFCSKRCRAKAQYAEGPCGLANR